MKRNSFSVSKWLAPVGRYALWIALVSFIVGILASERWYMLFFMLAWFFVGVWVLVQAVAGWIKKEIGFHGDGGESMTFHGNTARFLSAFIFFLGLILFVLPALGLMIQKIFMLFK